jgi:class 3 adenylate cyclase
MAEPPSGTVTLLFSDIEGSTRLLQRTGGDAYAHLLAEHRRLLAEVFDRHNGFHVGGEGDSCFVAFASADDAAAAAGEAQRALTRHAWPEGTEVRVRIGLHSGEPRVIGDDYVGLDVHQAARVMAAGHGGQVLLTDATRALLHERFEVRDLGDHRLKDLAGSRRLYQLQADPAAPRGRSGGKRADCHDSRRREHGDDRSPLAASHELSSPCRRTPAGADARRRRRYESPTA